MSSVRDAVRSLRASPIVTIVASVSLALGIGANTAMFSIVDALVLRDLPVRHASRLTMLFDDVNRSGFWSHPIWESIKRRPGLFDGAFAFSGYRFNLAERGEVDPADGLWASGRMFEVLGERAQLGRTFTEADDQIGGGPDGPVAVISHSFWQQRYRGDPGVVGQTIRLSGAPFTIVGVTGPRFFGPEVGRTFDVAVPLNTEPLVRFQRSGLNTAGSWLQLMIRLGPGQTAAQATTAFRAIQPEVRQETLPTGTRPQDLERYLSSPLTIRPGATVSGIRDQFQKPIWALMAIVGLTLLIACGNIANVLLARATARRHEYSVRSALGASAGRLGRQMLSESAVLSILGAGLGLLIAIGGGRFLVQQISGTTNRVFNRVYLDVGVDWRVLLFTTGVAVLTTLLFGAGPALRSARVAPIDAMRDHGRGTSSGRQGLLARSLVTMQVALSLVLLVGAGRFVRTFATLAGTELGFTPGRALVVELGTERVGTDTAGRLAMYERIIESVSRVPGVVSAGLSSVTPVSGSNSTRYMSFPDRPELPERERRVWMNSVTPGWLGTMGMTLVTGREFDGRDRLGASRSVVVNETFARKYFAGVNPIGRMIVEAQPAPGGAEPLYIIGVVKDAVYRSLREPVPPTMYWTMTQQGRPPVAVALLVRLAPSAMPDVSRNIAAAVTRVNDAVTTSARSYESIVDAALSQERLVARLSSFFGVLALLLAALGLFGTTSYSVSQRHTELGIRMALGTAPSGVARLVMSRVLLLLAAGLAIGVLVSWWAARFVQGLLFGVPSHDILTMAGAMAVLTVTALLAGWIPARRAASIDPARVLRNS